MPPKVWQSVPVDSLTAAATQNAKQPADAAKQRLEGKLITFDAEGRATSAQDTLKCPQPEQFNWQRLLATEAVATAARQERARALA